MRALVMLLGLVALAPAASALLLVNTTFSYDMLDDGSVRFLGEPPEVILDCPGGWLVGGSTISRPPAPQWRAEFVLSQRPDGTASLTAYTSEGWRLQRSTIVCPSPQPRAPDAVGELQARVPTVGLVPAPPAPAPSPNPMGWHELTTNAQLAPYDTSRPVEGIAFYHCARARLVPTAPLTTPALAEVTTPVPFTGRLSMSFPEWQGPDVLVHRTGTYLAGLGPWDLTIAGAGADAFATSTGAGEANCQDGWWRGTADFRAEGLDALGAPALGGWQGFVQSCHAECP